MRGKGLATIAIIAITAFVAAGVSVGASYYVMSESGIVADNSPAKTDSLSQEADGVGSDSNGTEESMDEETLVEGGAVDAVDRENWNKLSLVYAEGSLKYPAKWTLGEINQLQDKAYWKVDTPDTAKEDEAYIYEYDMDKWLDGPNPEDGYVLQADKRKEAYELLGDIYESRKLTPDSRMRLNDYGVEFFTYSYSDRAGVNYLESEDGFSRGFVMTNTRGQDVGLASRYVATLYNKKNNSVVSLSYSIPHTYKELKEITSRYGNYDQGTDELTRIDGEVHRDFVDIMDCGRDDLSFGELLDEVDAVATSLSY